MTSPTLVTVTHQWENADGSVPNGSVSFTLNSQSEGAQGVTVDTQPVIAELVNGAISQELVANVDQNGDPDGSYYTVVESIVGSVVTQYPITITPDGPTDLWALREIS